MAMEKKRNRLAATYEELHPQKVPQNLERDRSYKLLCIDLPFSNVDLFSWGSSMLVWLLQS